MARKNRSVSNVSTGDIIYDDGYTTVTASPGSGEPVQPPEPPFEAQPVSVVDMLDTLAGYVIPVINMGATTEGNGQCLLCGKKTAYKMRKLCVDCMNTYGKSYYEKAKIAIENGDTMIE